MNFSETVSFNPRQLADLQKLVRTGEGRHLEFKRKAAYPNKVICELIAFANTEGGTLLIGVDDDGSIPGVKYPEEEVVVVRQSLQNHCRPGIVVEESIIPISAKKFVVRLDVRTSLRKPHFFSDSGSKECYVRLNDMSVKASREMTEIVRRSNKKKDIRFTFGDSEKRLMEHLEERGTITLQEFRQVARLNRFLAAKKLILLVLANVLKITPSEKGDVYSRA
jgi:predicted HTH transcriptional regulator